MKKFIVHIRRHTGWYTTEAEGATFAEAAVSAVIATALKYGLDVNTVPHTVAYREDDGYSCVVFTETSKREIFGGCTRPGELWFADRVRQGEPDDCPSCGGTGIDYHNPFQQCWSCGDRTQRGQSSGKRLEAEA